MNFINILNIERLVLSSIFFDYEQIFEVSLILKKDDFYLKAHQDIYQVMLALHDEGLPIDEDFIRNRVPKEDFTPVTKPFSTFNKTDYEDSKFVH